MASRLAIDCDIFKYNNSNASVRAKAQPTAPHHKEARQNARASPVAAAGELAKTKSLGFTS